MISPAGYSKAATAAVIAAMMLGVFSSASACTLFAARGDGLVAGGGTLAVKVRDWHPDLQVVKTVRPSGGYAFYGLLTGRRERFNMGINEKGLFIGTSTAGTVRKATLEQYPRVDPKTNLKNVETLIRSAATVDEAIRMASAFTRPVNYILADKNEIAVVEVPPGGPAVVRRTLRGTLVQTNHYVLPGALHGNERRTSESSRTRYERAGELLRSLPRPAGLEHFVAITRDQHDGPDRSIFRVGSSPEKSRTRAVCAVHLHPDGSIDMVMTHAPDRNDPEYMPTKRLHFAAGSVEPVELKD